MVQAPTLNLWRGESDAQIAARLDEAYPTLRFAVGGKRRIIRGAFNVEHQGQFLACFQIEILLDATDVLGLPTVREVGGRIPRIEDRHINTADGSACLYLPDDLAARSAAPFDIVSFLDGPVRTYFLGQAGVELGVPFPFGEWGHGVDGQREMLTELVGLSDIATCLRFLELVSQKVVKLHWPCPCGSRRPLRDCHQNTVRRLRKLPLATRRFLLARATSNLGNES